MDQATKEFFRSQQQDPANQTCVDSGAPDGQWASVTHGCYISLESSGVHRGLGVHISFVRSTTMDSWKPLQLKLMELGGNQKLKAFFRLHNIADELPIVQKYNTRAAEWYRKNLRALAEGTESPPPLPEGTGCLPIETSLPTQVAYRSSPASGSVTSPGIPFGSGNGYHGGGSYHGGGYHDVGSSPAGGGGYSNSSAPTSLSSETSFGSASRSPQGAARDGDDFFSGILGAEVGSKVSGGFWTALSATKKLAFKAKQVAEDKVVQAQNEGWVDAFSDTAKQGVGAAVETTSWAAQRSVEAGKASYSYVNEKGGMEVLSKTTEVLGNTAKSSVAAAGSGVEWLSEHMLKPPSGNATALQGMSSGRMQGFGSDCSPQGAQASVATASSVRSYHDQESARHVNAPSESSTTAPKADIWSDEAWDDWN